jgi:hypothetical protein
MNTAPTYLTGAAGAVRRAEITARLIAGEPMKAIAAAVGVSVSHVARLARAEEIERVWLTRPEAALIAQLRAPTLTCPECAAPVNKTALTPQQFPRGGTFWQCPHCAVGCQPTAWKPAAPARTAPSDASPPRGNRPHVDSLLKPKKPTP